MAVELKAQTCPLNFTRTVSQRIMFIKKMPVKIYIINIM